jgi:hypothetical protein
MINTTKGSPSSLPSMSLEPRTLERVAREFPESDQPLVIELLSAYSGPEPGRVARDILELSKTNVQVVRHYLQAAERDYRDVLYWAEYYDTDPLLARCDPRQVIDGLIAKWEDKK